MIDARVGVAFDWVTGRTVPTRWRYPVRFVVLFGWFATLGDFECLRELFGFGFAVNPRAFCGFFSSGFVLDRCGDFVGSGFERGRRFFGYDSLGTLLDCEFFGANFYFSAGFYGRLNGGFLAVGNFFIGNLFNGHLGFCG